MVRETKQMRIYNLLKERIESGFYPPGYLFPDELKLAKELQVSRVTLRPALELLKLENLIVRQRGLGTYVRDRKKHQTRIMVLVHAEEFRRFDNGRNPFLYILPCIQLAAERMNASLEICDAASLLASDPDQCVKRLLASGVQGILWLGNNFTGKEPLLETIRKTRLPVLLPHANAADAEITGFTAMATNFTELTRDGLKYLALTGHRRVGYIGGRDMHHVAASDYLDWVKAAELDPDPELLRLIDWRQGKQTVFDAVESLLKLSEPPTAIFSYSDYLSIQIYEYLHRGKIRIPEDIAVLTTGGQIGCDFLDPPLSALEFGNQEIADLAVKTILQMIHDNRRMKFIVTPHRLVVRESTKKVILHHNSETKRKGART